MSFDDGVSEVYRGDLGFGIDFVRLYVECLDDVVR